MEKKLSILKKRREFVQVANLGCKAVTSTVVLQAFKRPEENKFEDAIRVGFTTSRKVGNAVKRNRVRRRLRIAARDILPQKGHCFYDYVLIGRARTFEASFNRILSDLRCALSQVDEA